MSTSLQTSVLSCSPISTLASLEAVHMYFLENVQVRTIDSTSMNMAKKRCSMVVSG